MFYKVHLVLCYLMCDVMIPKNWLVVKVHVWLPRVIWRTFYQHIHKPICIYIYDVRTYIKTHQDQHCEWTRSDTSHQMNEIIILLRQMIPELTCNTKACPHLQIVSTIHINLHDRLRRNRIYTTSHCKSHLKFDAAHRHILSEHLICVLIDDLEVSPLLIWFWHFVR